MELSRRRAIIQIGNHDSRKPGRGQFPMDHRSREERGPIVGPVPFRIFFPFSEEKKENEEEVSRSIANNTEICYFIRNGNRARRSVKESVPAGIQVCVSPRVYLAHWIS